MSTMTDNGFNARIEKVERVHRRMAHGYDARIGRDGLILFRPRPARSKRRLPLRGLLAVLVAVVGFKALVLTQIGDMAYQARIDDLVAGTPAEHLGGYVLGLDPVTRMIADQLAPFF